MQSVHGAQFHHSRRSFSLPGWLREGMEGLHGWWELVLSAWTRLPGPASPYQWGAPQLSSCLVVSYSSRQCQLRFTAQIQRSAGEKAKPYKFLPIGVIPQHCSALEQHPFHGKTKPNERNLFLNKSHPKTGLNAKVLKVLRFQVTMFPFPMSKVPWENTVLLQFPYLHSRSKE